MVVPGGIVFILFYLVSFVLVYHFNDWFLVWIGLELNMMSFIVLVYDSVCDNGVVSCYSYFFIQGLGSGVLLAMFFSGLEGYMLSFVLWLSMGLGVFWFWYVDVIGGLSWFSCFVVMVFQKIILLIMLEELGGSIYDWWVIVFSLLIGALGSINQVSLSGLVGYSSVQHGGWIVMLQSIGGVVWFFYLFLYGLVLVGVIEVFYSGGYEDLCFSGEYFVLVWLGVMSLGGIPPFFGFLLKLISFFCFWFIQLFMVSLMILVSVFMVYVYLRLIFVGIMGGLSWGVGGFVIGGSVGGWLSLFGGLLFMVLGSFWFVSMFVC